MRSFVRLIARLGRIRIAIAERREDDALARLHDFGLVFALMIEAAQMQTSVRHQMRSVRRKGLALRARFR